MAKGKKKRKGQTWKKQTPQSLRQLWDAVEGAPLVVKLPLRLGGHEVHTYDDLLAAYQTNPRLVSIDMERWVEQALKVVVGNEDTAKAEHAAAKQRLELLRGSRDMAERIGHLDHGVLTPEREEAMRAIMAGSHEEGESFLGVLGVIARLQETTGRTPKIGEVKEATGLPDADLARLIALASKAGLATPEGTRVSFNEAIIQKREPTDEQPQKFGETGFKPKGMVSMPTATVRHFAELARKEGLPLALSEQAITTLAPLARHLVVESAVEETEDGHSYVRAELICGCRAMLTDDPEMGKYAGLPLLEVAKDLTSADLPAPLEEIRQTWAERGWMEEGPDGEWRWLEHMRDVELQVAEWELKKLDVQEIHCDFPLRQFGLLIEAGNVPVPEDAGEEMPIHGGARSFAAIWRRQTRLAEQVSQEGASVRGRAERELSTRPDEPVKPEQVKDFLAPNIAWAGRAVAASGVLNHLRCCRTVAVDMDVSEGLPDWESPGEAWAYADEAELPFPVTYFDFTTPGGYRPKLAAITTQGTEIDLSLRAAVCWKQDRYLTIAPFVWFGEAPNDPDDLLSRTDYDSPGALHFGLSDRLTRTMSNGRSVSMEDELEPVTHMRITSESGISGPSQLVMTGPLFDQPGWVDLFSEMHEMGDSEADEILKAEAMMTATAACRVLSVIYALDGTVNIELVEGEPARPERREVERAQRKGKVAEISMTVRIHPTKQDEREPSDRPGKREYSHAFFRRGHFAHYPIGTRMADRMAESAPSKLVNHPVKGLCRKIYRKPTIVGRIGADGEERTPVAKSYVWGKAKHRDREEQAAA